MSGVIIEGEINRLDAAAGAAPTAKLAAVQNDSLVTITPTDINDLISLGASSDYHAFIGIDSVVATEKSTMHI